MPFTSWLYGLLRNIKIVSQKSKRKKKKVGNIKELPKLSPFLQYPVGDHTCIGSGWCEGHRRGWVRGKRNRHCRARGCLNRRRRCCGRDFARSGGILDWEQIALPYMKSCRKRRRIWWEYFDFYRGKKRRNQRGAIKDAATSSLLDETQWRQGRGIKKDWFGSVPNHLLVAGLCYRHRRLSPRRGRSTLVAVEPEEEGGSRLPSSEEETDPHGATPGRQTPTARLGLLSSIWCRFRDEWVSSV